MILFQLGEGQRLADFNLIKATLALLFVFRLLIRCSKTLEFNYLTGGFKNILAVADFNRQGLINGLCHLAGEKTIVDQFINSVLIGGCILLNHLGCDFKICGADRFMCILRTFLGFKVTAGSWIIIIAEVFNDVVFGCICRIIRNTQRVGSHIGDQTDGPKALNINSFV